MSRRESSPMDPVSAGGAGAGAGVGAGADAGGGDGATGAAEADTDRAGFTSQALSSKPSALFPGTEADARGVATASATAGFLTVSSVFCSKAFGSTTSLVCTGGAGRPLRVLFLRVPPGPEKRPPDSSPFSAKLTLRLSPPVRLYLASRNFITRRISPSLTPKVRRSFSVMSGMFSSPIWSRVKACAYLSQI